MQLSRTRNIFKYLVSPAFGIMLMYAWFNLDDFFEPEHVLRFMSALAIGVNIVINLVRDLFN